MAPPARDSSSTGMIPHCRELSAPVGEYMGWTSHETSSNHKDRFSQLILVVLGGALSTFGAYDIQSQYHTPACQEQPLNTATPGDKNDHDPQTPQFLLAASSFRDCSKSRSQASREGGLDSSR